MVRPSTGPSPSADTSRRTPRQAPAAAPTGGPHRPPAAPPPGWAHPEPHPRRAHPGTPIQVPPAVAEAFPRNAEVCALGRRYGGWPSDSPEAVICRSTYGR